MSPTETAYWYCVHCAMEVDSRAVTNDERCGFCGHPVRWIESAGTVFVLDDDQIGALRSLLDLIHYDDLAATWHAMLPTELTGR